jgi:hypothetical protein
VRRQDDAAASWCKRNGVTLDTSLTLRDCGVSAFKGRQRSDKTDLKKFLDLVEAGRVRKGTYFLIENLDRLSREEVVPAVNLLTGILLAGIKVVQLSPHEFVMTDKSPMQDIMFAIMELSRGHSESAMKSDRVGKAWNEKRKQCRDQGKTITQRLPAWIRERDGKRELLPAAAAAIKRIFHLAANGYGEARIVQKLTQDKIPAFGASGHWTRAYVRLLLTDRRVLGEFQLQRDGVDEGEPIRDYFPAVITKIEWLAAQEGRGQRKHLVQKSRIGKRLDIFSGLVHDARGGMYFAATRNDAGVQTRVLVNTRATEGLAKYTNFPLPVFEQVVLSWLREIDPAEVLTADDKDRTPLLQAELKRVRRELGQVRADLEERYLRTTADLAEKLETREAELVEQLEEAEAHVICPASNQWKQVGELIDRIATEADVEEIRLRLRAAVRRIVERIVLLVMPVQGKRERLAFIHLHFRDGKKVRLYAIVYRPTINNRHIRTPARFWATYLDVDAVSGPLQELPPERVAANAQLIKEMVEARQRGEQIEIVDD